MALILARSPFFVSNQGFDEGALLTVTIDRISDDELNVEVFKTYNLNFRKQTEIDISPLVLPYAKDKIKGVRVTVSVSGEINEVAQSDVVAYHVATDGYFYHEDGYNYDATTDLQANAYYAGSNDCIYRLDDDAVRFSVLSPTVSGDQIDNTSLTITYLRDGDIQKTDLISLSTEIGQYQKFVSSYGVSETILDFESRVLLFGGTFEGSKCLNDFYDAYNVDAFDTIRISDDATGVFKDIKVVTIEECKYNPYRVEFKNKLGAKEDFWFFKRSDKSLEVTREQYRKNVFDSYSSGNRQEHQYSNFNVMGRESMVLNTGWIPESFYENLKQLHLSESVWIYIYNINQKVPINIKSGSIDEILHVNDKLVNYEVEIEFSYDAISNIV